MTWEDLWNNETMRSDAILTVAYIVVVIVCRAVVLRFVRSAEWLNDTGRLAWLGRVRLATVLALVGGLTLIWAAELQALAFSAVAIAAAIVIATKELIMCISGGVVRQVSGAFDVGDRIELAGHRGDVVRVGFFSLSLLEIGPGQQRTGRAIAIPNSLLLSQSVVNESFTDDYVLHVTTVPYVPEDSWHDAERVLLAAANAAVADHLDAARRHMEAKSAEHGLSAPSVDPRVFVQVSGEAQRTLLVRFPAPAHERAKLEQQILRAYSAAKPEPESESESEPERKSDDAS